MSHGTRDPEMFTQNDVVLYRRTSILPTFIIMASSGFLMGLLAGWLLWA